jgi:hypothetical protein
MDPRVRLRETPLAIKDEECQRIIWVIAVTSQERSTKVALHGNEAERRLALVMLEPPRTAAAEIA